MIRTKVIRRLSISVGASSQHRKDSQPGSKGGHAKEQKNLPNLADCKVSLKLARIGFKASLNSLILFLSILRKLKF